MLEITQEMIEKFTVLMHDHAGYAASRNADRILDDLHKQAELLGAEKTSIPVTLKMTVEGGDDGLHLTVESVDWKVTRKTKDDSFYTVDLDPRQPDLPGFDQPEPSPKPVIEAKALPEHEEDKWDDVPWGLILNGAIKTNFRENLEGIVEKGQLPIVMRGVNDHQVHVYWEGCWVDREVPSVDQMLAEADDGNHIVFVDGVMTETTQRSLVAKGCGLTQVRYRDGVWEEWRADGPDGEWRKRQIFQSTENDTKQFAQSLAGMSEVDDCLLPSQLELAY